MAYKNMNEKFLKLAEKIFENEKLLKEISEVKTFDKLYDMIKLQSKSKINEVELKEFMNKHGNLNRNNLNNLDETQLNSVAGGASSLKNKAIASALGFLTMAQIGAGMTSAKGISNESGLAATAVSTSKKSQTQNGRFKKWLSKHKTKAIVGGSGAAFIIAIGGAFLAKELSKSPSEKILHEIPFDLKFGENTQYIQIEDKLLNFVRNLWKKFWETYNKSTDNNLRISAVRNIYFNAIGNNMVNGEIDEDGYHYNYNNNRTDDIWNTAMDNANKDDKNWIENFSNVWDKNNKYIKGKGKSYFVDLISTLELYTNWFEKETTNATILPLIPSNKETSDYSPFTVEWSAELMNPGLLSQLEKALINFSDAINNTGLLSDENYAKQLRNIHNIKNALGEDRMSIWSNAIEARNQCDSTDVNGAPVVFVNAFIKGINDAKPSFTDKQIINLTNVVNYQIDIINNNDEVKAAYAAWENQHKSEASSSSSIT